MSEVMKALRPERLCLLACTTRRAIFYVALISPFSVASEPETVVTPANAEATLAVMRSSETKSVLVAAHRGGYAADKEDQAPENSVENIGNCQRRGYDVYETDIQRTKDGRFVMIHDATIDRELTGTGEAEDMEFADLKRLHKRYRDGSVSEARVASLEEFLEEGRGRVVFKADLKPGVCRHFDELLTVVRENKGFDGIVFRAFYRDMPAFVEHRENGMRWPRGLVMFRVKNRHQLDDVVNGFDPTWIHIDVNKDDPTNAKTLELIRYARERKLCVQVHAEGTPADWMILYDAGARMFHTTKPAKVAEFRATLQPSP